MRLKVMALAKSKDFAVVLTSNSEELGSQLKKALGTLGVQY